MHAIGEGLLIAEIQQCSNTTFRVFDWNRVDSDGNPRQLHIDQAIAATDFSRGPVDPVAPQSTEHKNCSVLVESEKFVMRRWNFEHANQHIQIGDHDRFRIFAVTKGNLVVEDDPSELALSTGQTMFLPASIGSITVSSNAATELLEIYVPDQN